MRSMSCPTPSFVAFSLCALGLSGVTACSSGDDGDGGGSSTTEASGQIFDALVEGLHYSSGSVSGLTDVNGYFAYQTGSPVTFSVGDIVLGSVEGSSLISIPDFVEGVHDYDPTQVGEVLNIAQFLQTIDDDADPTNGIFISAATREAAAGQTMEFDLLDWDENEDVHATLELLTDNPMVPEGEATAHGNAWLSASYAGEYWGTFAAANGSLSGTLRLSVGNAGGVAVVGYAGPWDPTQGHNAHEIVFSSNSEDPIDPDGNFFIEGPGGRWIAGQIQGTSVAGWYKRDDSGSFSAELALKPLTFLDNNHVDPVILQLLDKDLFGPMYDNAGVEVGACWMGVFETDEGLYEFIMEAAPYPAHAKPWSEDGILYATAMDAETLSFRGLCEWGAGFSGDIVLVDSTPTVSGSYYGLNGEPGGTFELSYDDSRD